MYVKEVTVENQVGLHARPATFFIQKANEFKSSIWVEKEERRVNAKSLLGVLSLGIVRGTTIRIIADGADEQAAVDGLIKLVRVRLCRVIFLIFKPESGGDSLKKPSAETKRKFFARYFALGATGFHRR